MELELKRIARKERYTIGRLSVDGTYFCDTLEDTDRGLSDSMTLEEIKTRKVFSQTAIPTGTYTVGIHYWVKHRRNVPILNGVKGFSGILIHAGCTHEDTMGCILVGRNTEVGRLTNSYSVSVALTSLVRAAMVKGERVTIKIS